MEKFWTCTADAAAEPTYVIHFGSFAINVA